MNRSFSNPLVITLATLYGCAPAPEQADAGAVPAPEPVVATETGAPPAADPFVMFNMTMSVRDLMNAVINRNARELWNGVSYVQTEQGVVETIPQTQEDWDRLRANAVALIEGGNALMLPGRRIDTSATVTTPDFQFTPQEIEQLLIDDPDNWIINLQAMQDSVLRTLEMIDKKDILGFTERGAIINESCETCHAQYWYKPLPVRR